MRIERDGMLGVSRTPIRTSNKKVEGHSKASFYKRIQGTVSLEDVCLWSMRDNHDYSPFNQLVHSSHEFSRGLSSIFIVKLPPQVKLRYQQQKI